ncbi:MGH1-like glycoside hydrolase domain-containing protein [Phycisphaera mikurensis]|uniref:Putative glycoside hydrolase n=1 Tax=Phycisphaera mikurensis (strain NBRC 102666 / KCTC 22515 / FYK2301M01) TaxID=1142394 RepID=I0ICP9_PHYMF|nr:trehalase family glycosidase [Phycisphaera mikurensis]MBB6442089.1 glycogen debranching enzyme [Phycisphaera mikurensis]BAM03037.1 putative glycoside hydrolase [Phycisphaera mikurensis NBRC 102666]
MPTIPGLAAAAETASADRPAWAPMLAYVADLHGRSVREDTHGIFPHPWEEIGPGYCYGPAFGHWDIVHQCHDTVLGSPGHAQRQLENTLALQQDDGRMPPIFRLLDGKPDLHNPRTSHPPVWALLVERLVEAGVDPAIRRRYLPHAVKQLGWFDANRRTEEGLYGYADLTLEGSFESGVDDGVRFLDGPTDRLVPFVDASSHAWLLMDAVARWGDGERAAEARRRADTLAERIRGELWHDGLGLFVDGFRTEEENPPMALEGMWPLVLGIASAEQADRFIDGWLLDPDAFFGVHPCRTVARKSIGYEMRMWRGPAWNSMTFWACSGCVRYGRHDAAARILERALDDSAAHFDRTGTIFEFYHPDGDAPESVARKPYAEDAANQPCPDYLGHNPMIAMADLWQRVRSGR